jgi:hypothetical protein
MGHDAGKSEEAGTSVPGGADVFCRHCHRALWHEDLWGWLHLDNSYLCRHPATGEILFTPAEPLPGKDGVDS